MAQLLAPFLDLVVFVQDSVHGADRTEMNALVEQGRPDLGRRLIDEAWLSQNIQNVLALVRR